MNYKQPIKINFSAKDRIEVQNAIAEMIINLMGAGITVIFQDQDEDTPILPCSVHSLSRLPKRSHLQYRLGSKKTIGGDKDVLIPSMVVVKYDTKIKDTCLPYIWVFYCLLHEYSHTKTLHNVKRINDKIEIDQEDCEYQCIKYMKKYLYEQFNVKLADKLWMVIKSMILFTKDSCYNKAFAWLFDLQKNNE